MYPFRTFNITYVSLCHNLSLLHTITTLNHPHRYSCLRHDTPHCCLCTSPDAANHAPRPMGVLDLREMVTIVGNTVGHHHLLELVIEHAENDVAPTPATMTAGGCTLNSLTSLTAIPPGAQCVRSMGHTSPLRLWHSYAHTNAHATTSCICRTDCYSTAPSKTWIGCPSRGGGQQGVAIGQHLFSGGKRRITGSSRVHGPFPAPSNHQPFYD